MNLFDIIVLTIIISSALLGLYKGMIKLGIGFIFFLLTIISTYFLFAPVEMAVSEYIENELAINIVSSVISYLIAMLFFAFLSSRAAKLVDGISGGMVDRLLGLFLGTVRGLFISAIIFGATVIFACNAYVGSSTTKDIVDKIDQKNYPKWLVTALTFKTVEKTVYILGSLIPANTLEKINLPVPPKHLPDISSEVIEKAAKAATEATIENAMKLQKAKPEAATEEESKKLHDSSDNLDMQLKEILGE